MHRKSVQQAAASLAVRLAVSGVRAEAAGEADTRQGLPATMQAHLEFIHSYSADATGMWMFVSYLFSQPYIYTIYILFICMRYFIINFKNPFSS